VTIAEASYTAAALTPDTNVRNAMWPPASVRAQTLNTAAVLAAKVGTFAREASDYWDKFIALMAAQKTPIKVDLDFASRGSQ
jgi:hypothetical protein